MPGEVTIRKRKLPRVLSGREDFVYDGNLLQRRTGELDISGTQRTVSEGHQVSLLGNTDADIGGDFHSFKSEIVHVSCPNGHVEEANGGPWRYFGPILPPSIRPLREDEVNLRSVQELNALGATAISRCSPVDSRAELLTSVAETLNDGLPSIIGAKLWDRKTKVCKDAGSEYLNVQFGWVPLISDVRSTLDSYKNAAKILHQLKRDSGRNVRRRYEFPLEVETEMLLNESGQYGGLQLESVSNTALARAGYYNSEDYSGTVSVQRETKTQTWFSGAFTYHLPVNDSQFGKVASAYVMLDHLYGVGLTPDVLWNLTPWSWATDWFANTGDVMSNISNSLLYGQILRYGYLMEKTTIIDRHRSSPSNFRGGGSFEAVVKTTVKRRIRANPFGFGITFDELDAYQLSILAALGMSQR